MSRCELEKVTVPEGETREMLIQRIMRLDCGSRKLSREQAEDFADDVWPFHPQNPHSAWTDAEIDQHVKETLTYHQNERTLEQNFLLGALGRWLLYAAPFIAGALYAFTLTQREQRIQGFVLPVAVVMVITYGFHDVVQTARRALDHRHTQVRILTQEFPKFRAWGFRWRDKDGQDRDHRVTARHAALSMGLLAVILAILAFWVAYFS
jgi:hypothetical protein